MIRRITKDDRAVYLRMAHDFYHSSAVDHPIPDAYLERTFDELMRSDAYAEAYLFEDAGQIAGYALLAKTWSQEAGGETVWVEELYILPEYRGRGLGSAFFAFLRAHLHPARFRLETEPDNLRAKALYARQGFRPLPYDSMIIE